MTECANNKKCEREKKKHRTMWNTFWLCVAMNLNYHQALSVVQYIVCITVMHMEHLWTWVWVCVTLFVHVRARNDVCFLFFDLFNFFLQELFTIYDLTEQQFSGWVTIVWHFVSFGYILNQYIVLVCQQEKQICFPWTWLKFDIAISRWCEAFIMYN